jgi:hypothetical protein
MHSASPSCVILALPISFSVTWLYLAKRASFEAPHSAVFSSGYIFNELDIRTFSLVRFRILTTAPVKGTVFLFWGSQMFRSNVSPPSSESSNKPKKKSTELRWRYSSRFHPNCNKLSNPCFCGSYDFTLWGSTRKPAAHRAARCLPSISWTLKMEVKGKAVPVTGLEGP